MADERNVSHMLNAHHAGELAVMLLVTPEGYFGADVACELRCPHVRLMPTVRRNRIPVTLGRRVDDRQDRSLFIGAAAADRAHEIRRHGVKSKGDAAPLLDVLFHERRTQRLVD